MGLFKSDIRIINKDFIIDATKAVESEIRSLIIDTVKQLRPNVILFVEEALRNDPSRTYDSLANGKLNFDFGFNRGENVAEEVVKEISKNINFTTLYRTSKSVGGIRLEVLKKGIGFLLDKGFASYPSNEYKIDWLKWLLTAGDTIIIADYEVFYKNNIPTSRSGGAIMIKPSESKGFRVDPRHSGVEDDNWITRALLSAEVKIYPILEKALRQII